MGPVAIWPVALLARPSRNTDITSQLFRFVLTLVLVLLIAAKVLPATDETLS